MISCRLRSSISSCRHHPLLSLFYFSFCVMWFLKSWWMCQFFSCPSLRWMPCHEFLMSLSPPRSQALVESEALAFGNEANGEGSWMSLRRRWSWPGVDGFKLFLVLLLISTMFAEVRYITSSSMLPTFRAGDRIIAEKVSYYFWSPSVDDIVLFRATNRLQDFGFKKEDVFIKRIVAKAGDYVESCCPTLLDTSTLDVCIKCPEDVPRFAHWDARIMAGWSRLNTLDGTPSQRPVLDGVLFINGIAQTEEFVAEKREYRKGAIRVPAGHVYVVGDNRNNSCDSRAWGPLPVANIVGRYVMCCSRLAGR